MERIKPPAVRFVDGVFVIEPGDDYSHLHKNVLEHLTLLPLLAESIQPPLLVLDMKPVQFIGSAAIGELVLVSRRLKSRHGAFALASANRFCQTTLGLASLESMLPNFESTEAAIRHLTSMAVPTT
ncbi:MAG: STAS domain-containing protein [Fuerstiella sp.]